MGHRIILMVLAAVIGVVGALLLGRLLIPWLHRLKFGQPIREAGPASHHVKAGVPTMGGVIFLVPMLAASFILAGNRPVTWVLAGLAVGHAALGFADDYLKVVRRVSTGLKARYKLVGQVILAGGFAWAALVLTHGKPWALPGGGDWSPGILFVPIVMLAVMGATNAVNFTDGLDGQAGGTSVIAFLFYTAWAVNAGQFAVALVALATAAALVGFLRYNLHPARVIMGDTGALMLGALLAGVAVLSQSVLLLPLVGGVFVAEVLSVVIQVASFQLFGRRVFRMTPFHHHLELSGWPEERVVTVFWVATALLALIAWR